LLSKKPNSINILLAVEQDSLHCDFLQCNNIPNKKKIEAKWLNGVN
jgi:hypothetical protein